jgi:hypothetical protein
MQLQRLRQDNIQDGLEIVADDLNVEFNQLVDGNNDLDERLETAEGSILNKTVQWLGSLSGNALTATIQNAPTTIPNGFEVSLHVASKVAVNTPFTLALNTFGVKPVKKAGGLPVTGRDLAQGSLAKLQYYVDSWYLLNDTRLSMGYFSVPTPEYSGSTSVSLNGAASFRDRNNQVDIHLSDVGRVVNLSSGNALNGRAETGAVSNNSFYHLFGVMSDDLSQSGYVLSLNASATTFTLGGVTYSNVRRLPLSVKTNASGAILPFMVEHWSGAYSTIQYLTNFWRNPNDSGQLPTANETVVDGNRAPTSNAFVSIACAEFVPAGAKYARINLSCAGAAVGRVRHASGGVMDFQASGEQYDAQDLAITPWVELSASRGFDLKVLATSGPVTSSVFAYKLEV